MARTHVRVGCFDEVAGVKSGKNQTTWTNLSTNSLLLCKYEYVMSLLLLVFCFLLFLNCFIWALVLKNQLSVWHILLSNERKPVLELDLFCFSECVCVFVCVCVLFVCLTYFSVRKQLPILLLKVSFSANFRNIMVIFICFLSMNYQKLFKFTTEK